MPVVAKRAPPQANGDWRANSHDPQADGLHPCGFRVLGSASTSQTLLQQRGQAPRCHRLGEGQNNGTE